MKLDERSRSEAKSWLQLALVPGLRPATIAKLLAAFGSPHHVLSAARIAIEAVIESGDADALERGADVALVDATLRWLEHDDHHLVTIADASYPQALREISDPPVVIYAHGRVDLLNSPAFAIVGSRNATLQGARDAEAFAHELSQAGLCIVSGLAAGIDAAAHRGGLAGRGSSIAVMGTGPDRLYPASNRALGEALARSGCLLTEFALGTPPLSWNFPRRNRLISGLARGVLVVEAAVESGSLITARTALEQNRDVFAIPGSIHSAVAKGCHSLIKEGAKLVECAQDILEELGMHAAARASPRLPATREPLLDAMGFAPISLDRVAELTGLGAAAIAARLSSLEIEGRIVALAGGLFQRLENRVENRVIE